MAKTFPIDLDAIEKSHTKISILVDNPLPPHKGEGKEAYTGYILGYSDDVLVLETPDNTKIQGIAIRWSMIVSIWIYK